MARMASYLPLSTTTHAGQRWQRAADYHFAAHDAVVALVAQELPKAMLALPIGFVATGEAFTVVAVQGLTPGQNLWVAPDGRWLGSYTPAAYRGHPFALRSAEGGQQVLCIDQASLLPSSSAQGEPLLSSDGTPAPAVQQVLEFLTQVQANAEATARICAVLQQHQLIAPWPVTVQDGHSERPVQGLYRIDEAALNALPAEAFEAVRQAGALPVAYCQLLSMQHLPWLGQLAREHDAQLAAQQLPQLKPLPQKANGELDLEFLNQGGTLSFGHLQ